jgi:hypothetical protein
MKKVIILMFIILIMVGCETLMKYPPEDPWKTGVVTNGSIRAIGKSTKMGAPNAQEEADLKAKQNVQREAARILEKQRDSIKLGNITIINRRVRGNTHESLAELPEAIKLKVN